MFVYDTYLTSEKPVNMVFFLHGYNSNIEDHQQAIDWLKSRLYNAVLIVPHAPETSDKNPKRLQWFGMQKYDTENRRTQPETDTKEIYAIYNKTSAEIDARAAEINSFIDEMHKIYNINNRHTFLCGFSQGAMLAIYTALTRKSLLGGVFSLSGLVAGADLLATKINSYPHLYLFHGKEDMKVQFKTLPTTVDWLSKRKLPVYVRIFDKIDHKMTAEEMSLIADKINNLAE